MFVHTGYRVSTASPLLAPTKQTTVARVEFKAVKLMTKRRPKKTCKADKNRKPAVYDAPPPPPPEYVVVQEAQ